MTRTHRRGAEHLIAALTGAGIRRIFTLSGNHVMPVFDACVDADIELTHVRHEAAAVHMADAWARLTGQPGVALVTGGPGHANAVSALYTALGSESPVLLLSGHAPHAQIGRGAFQEMAQAEMAATVCKASWTAATAEGLAADVRQALLGALSGRPGPVHLSLPTDVLEQPVSADLPSPAALEPAALAPRPADAARIAQVLSGARRPLILTGPALMRGAGQAAASALERACAIPVIGMESPRGTNDPALGAFHEMLGQADAVLLLGKLPDFTLRFGAPFAEDAALVLVDAGPASIERGLAVLGPARAQAWRAGPQACAQVLAALPDWPGGDAGWAQAVREALAWRPPAWAGIQAQPGRPLHPVTLCRVLQPYLDAHPESVLIADGGEFGQWAQACLRAPRRIINGPAGAIGAALPFATAARLAAGAAAPVVALLGDGTAGFHLAEFDTAVRANAPFVAVVGNDACWNAEHQIQIRDYGAGRTIGCKLLPTRYDLAAAGLGAHGEHAGDVAALAGALERAFGAGRPACVNVTLEGLPAPTFKRG